MVAKTDIYRKLEDGLLHFVSSGSCLMFCPDNNDDHVTVALGDVRLYINKADFVKFAQQIVYSNNSGVSNVLVPR